ncbi:MAG: ribonuclease HI family protein [Proteobacteria bacterium]|uniref:ribonuclease HI family protein n=1 Tax=Aquabacterium sp. TaxID=1872578 RepID=UPI0035C76756|nr:ribonuclease HI family protein [Pseudomonadota bacterium]
MPARTEEPSGSFFLGPVDGHTDADAPTWVAHCDGGAWPNPGAMALGAVLVSPTGAVHHLSQRLSGSGCNNEAEWRATVATLREALALGARALRLHTDSTQVRDHLNAHLSQDGAGQPPPALPVALQAWVDEARALAWRLDDFCVRWVPRHRNGQADALARQALGLPPKPVLTPHPRARRRRR